LITPMTSSSMVRRVALFYFLQSVIYKNSFWIRFHVSAHLVLAFLVVLLVGATSSKKPKDPSFSNRIGMKFGRIVLQVPVNTHRLTESDYRFDVTLSTDGGHDDISRKKVVPSGECIRSVCSASMRQRPSGLDP